LVESDLRAVDRIDGARRYRLSRQQNRDGDRRRWPRIFGVATRTLSLVSPLKRIETAEHHGGRDANQECQKPNDETKH
jgi:hypothetical protein